MAKGSKDVKLSAIDLIVSAMDHLNSAFLLFEAGPRNFDSAGYLAQLGIELVFKAVIAEAAIDPPKVHNIKSLHTKDLLKDFFPLISGKEAEALLVLFDSFYQLRYPDPANPIEVGSEDAEKLVKLLEILQNRIPDSIKDAYWKKPPQEKSGRILMYRKKSSEID